MLIFFCRYKWKKYVAYIFFFSWIFFVSFFVWISAITVLLFVRLIFIDDPNICNFFQHKLTIHIFNYFLNFYWHEQNTFFLTCVNTNLALGIYLHRHQHINLHSKLIDFKLHCFTLRFKMFFIILIDRSDFISCCLYNSMFSEWSFSFRCQLLSSLFYATWCIHVVITQHNIKIVCV